MPKTNQAAGKMQNVELSSEEEATWRWRHRKELKGLNPVQKKAFNRYLRQKLNAIDPAELPKTRAELKSEWDTMPAAHKDKLNARIAGRAKAADARKSGAAQPGKTAGAG